MNGDSGRAAVRQRDGRGARRRSARGGERGAPPIVAALLAALALAGTAPAAARPAGDAGTAAGAAAAGTAAAGTAAGDAAAARAMAARVTIRRDGHGIAHIHGKSDADAVFGMSYAQAEDDFARIERNYLVALGRLAEAEGETALRQDLRQRLYVDEADLRRDYARAPGWLRALMDAWAAGLNHYLATHPAVKPRVLTRFEPWMTLAFSEGSIGGDIERGIELAPLGALYGLDAGGQVAMRAAAPGVAGMPGVAVMPEPQGSNGIAVAPGRTRDGHALLLINPHTSFYFRSEAQVTSDAGLDVYGASTWGQFFVYQGFNRHVAWMHTSSGVDNIDAFAETVAERDGKRVYRYGDAWRPVRERAIVLRYRTATGAMAERRVTALFTHHGPIVRREGDRMIAAAMMWRPLAALEQSYLRTRARSIAAFVRVSERRANSSNNTILAAADGSIAYLHPQFVPVRDDRFDYRRPVDGSDPATDWKGLHRLDTLPMLVSPKSGWIANTNNAPWSAAGASSPRAADFPRYMDQFGENPRGIHATRLLAAADALTPDTLRALAFDPALPLFEAQLPRLRRAFDALPPDDPRRATLAEPVAALDRWDRKWGLESTAMTLAAAWAEALWRRELPKANAATMPIFAYLDTRTADADRVAALDEAVARLTRDWGSWRVAWGRVNRFQRIDNRIPPHFDDAAPSIPVAFASGNFGSLASFATVRPAGGKCQYGVSGNSFVAIVEMGPRVRAWGVSVGGESGDPQSPHFDDQARLYAEGRFRPILIDEAALRDLPAYHPGSTPPGRAVTNIVPPPTRCGDD